MIFQAWGPQGGLSEKVTIWGKPRITGNSEGEGPLHLRHRQWKSKKMKERECVQSTLMEGEGRDGRVSAMNWVLLYPANAYTKIQTSSGTALGGGAIGGSTGWSPYGCDVCPYKGTPEILEVGSLLQQRALSTTQPSQYLDIRLPASRFEIQIHAL
jgi:hypothetical protein